MIRVSHQGDSAMTHHPVVRALLVLGLLGAAGSPLLAQYKVVDPDGRVTYTDRPTPSTAAKVQPMRATPGSDAVSSLPYELRQVAERYPVTLYSGDNCDACTAGRNMLRQRGVPFTEKTVKTDADIQALKRLESSSELPVLRIGTQQLKGYTDAEWRSYLDAAGYPAQSKLPASYKAAEPAPLVGQTTATPPARPVPPPQPPAQLPPALETAPQGIRF